MIKRWIAAAALSAAVGCSPPSETVAVGAPLGGFELPDLSGKTVRLSDFKGKVVLIDFWATYCVPCRDAVPELVGLQAKYKEQGLEVLGVSVDAYAEGVPDFVKEFGVNYTMLLDTDQDLQAAYGLRSLPETFLVGRDGVLLSHWMGYDDAVAKEIPAAVKAALQ